MPLYRFLNWLYGGPFLDDAAAPVGEDLNYPGHLEAPEIRLNDQPPRKVECGCCFSEFDSADTALCPSNHAFCLACIRTFSERQLLQNQVDIGCFDGSGCDALFHPSVLQRSMLPVSYKRWEDLSQDREIREARVEGLESCQFCRFKMIIEVDKAQEPLFRCLNLADGCGKISCRSCGKEDHSPRTCEEEEGRRWANPRRAVEEAMSAALMRKCPGCERAIIKERGCNHIVCPDPLCRVHFCYLCQRDITTEQYAHFHRNEEHNPDSARGANGKCLMWDLVQLEVQHAREVEAARMTAEVENARRALAQATVARPIPGPARERHPVQQAVVPPPRIIQAQQQRAQPAPVRPVVLVERRAAHAPRRPQIRPLLNPQPVVRPPPDPEPVPRPGPPVQAPAQGRDLGAQQHVNVAPVRPPAQVHPQGRPRIEEAPHRHVVRPHPPDWRRVDLRATPREEPEPESDEDTLTESSDDDDYLSAEESEDEDAFQRDAELIPLRQDIENAYEQVRKAWTSLAKSKHNLGYRWSVIQEREREVVKFNRQYDNLKAEIWGRRRQGGRAAAARLDYRQSYLLGIEASRMADALRRAKRRERDARSKTRIGAGLWTEERLEAYVRETRRLEQLMNDAGRYRWQ